MHKKVLSLTISATMLACTSSIAQAIVTTLQNGIWPTSEYAGCKDTWITDRKWESGRDYGHSPTISADRGRRILIQFDLSPIPSGDTIHKAVLRLADASFPRRGPDGKFPVGMTAHRMSREWNENANWLEHSRTDYKKQDEGDWATPGGEFDAEGVVATEHKLVAGSWGHMHELDITELVRLWHVGKAPNYGMVLQKGSTFAASEWPIPEYRPQLIVDHGRKASGIPALTPAPAEIQFDPFAAMPDSGTAEGDYAVVRIGQNPNCALRGKSTDAYIKENAALYPGTWGWMNECRVGGAAGDFDRTLLYFDLSSIPKSASIKEAKLVCSLVTGSSRNVRGFRYGVFLLSLPDTPGWVAEEVASGERKAGIAWPKGRVVAASRSAPLSLSLITQKEVQQRGRKTKIDAGIEFDLTGAVRAWISGKAPNCGVVLDNRIEGGAYDVYSCRSFRADLRPYLEITLSPAIAAKPEPMDVTAAAPTDDYWVEPMRQVHKKFRGRAGTLAQYGDSITVTMAYLASYAWSGEIRPKNMSAGAQADAELVEKYADLTLWRTWKGGQWGNTGMMKSDWLFRNIDGWQKKMNPETATIMFGTNDRGNIRPPQYTEYMAASVRRMLQDGTIPMLNSIPPPCDIEYWHAALSIARGLKIPLIDYYAETMRRRPDDYNGRLEKFSEYKGYDVPTIISRDGTHPSNPQKYRNDWSQEALSASGYGLRDYMTIRKFAEVIRKVYQHERDGE